MDDHTLFREASRALNADPELISSTARVFTALSLLAARSFDLVLLDHDLGGERVAIPAAAQIGYEGRC